MAACHSKKHSFLFCPIATMVKKTQEWMEVEEGGIEQGGRVWGLVPEVPGKAAEREVPAPSITIRGDEAAGTVEWLCLDCREWKDRDTCFYNITKKRNRKQCKQCQINYTDKRRQKREQADFCARISNNIRRRERRRGFRTHIQKTDVRAILEKYNFTCIITRKDVRNGCGTTLLPVHMNEELGPDNAVPICVGSRILTRILNGDYPDWQEIASSSLKLQT